MNVDFNMIVSISLPFFFSTSVSVSALLVVARHHTLEEP